MKFNDAVDRLADIAADSGIDLPHHIAAGFLGERMGMIAYQLGIGFDYACKRYLDEDCVAAVVAGMSSLDPSMN